MVSKARDPPSLLTISQVAERLSLNSYTVREMLRSGDLKGAKIRGRWRVRPSDLEGYIESRSNK